MDICFEYSAYLQAICSVIAIFTQQVTLRPLCKMASAEILQSIFLPSSMLVLGVG